MWLNFNEFFSLMSLTTSVTVPMALRSLCFFLSHSANFSEHKLHYAFLLVSVCGLRWYFKWLTIYDVVNYLWRWDMINSYGKRILHARSIAYYYHENSNRKFIVALKIWSQQATNIHTGSKKNTSFLGRKKKGHIIIIVV